MDHIFVSAGESIPDRLWHAAILRPDDPVAYSPAIVMCRSLDSTWDAG
jgi:hypothetical protein